jgi:hypothetical protein
LAAERSRKRGELLAATEKELEKVKAATKRSNRPLRGNERIAIAAGKALIPPPRRGSLPSGYPRS